MLMISNPGMRHDDGSVHCALVTPEALRASPMAVMASKGKRPVTKIVGNHISGVHEYRASFLIVMAMYERTYCQVCLSPLRMSYKLQGTDRPRLFPKTVVRISLFVGRFKFKTATKETNKAMA
jgi:hypothetical protein